MIRFLFNLIIAFLAFLFLSMVLGKIFNAPNPEQLDSEGKFENNALLALFVSFVITGSSFAFFEMKRLDKNEKNQH